MMYQISQKHFSHETVGYYSVWSTFKKLGQPRPPLSVYFPFFKAHIVQKTVGFTGIRTRTFGEEGKHDDHLTTTTTAKYLERTVTILSRFYDRKFMSRR